MRPILKGLVALLVLIPGTSHAKLDISNYIKFLIKQECIKQGVRPEFPMAVARVESGIGNQEFRTGPMGKGTYYGPFGIHKDFLRKWPINQLETNIAIGVRALRGGFKILHRYNASCNQAYLTAVRRAMRKYEEELYVSSK